MTRTAENDQLDSLCQINIGSCKHIWFEAGVGAEKQSNINVVSTEEISMC